MAELSFDCISYSCNEGESVLDCLLRHRVDYPNACRSGICQACLIKACEGRVDTHWQEGLPDILKSQAYFLACQAKPEQDLHLVAPDAFECETKAVLSVIEQVNHNVLKLKLTADALDCWIPGQNLNLFNIDGVCRSYSIANVPIHDGFIELHVKLKEQGVMSQWLNAARVDTPVRIRGPFGQCYYHNPNKASFDMLLTGTGTGLAPLLGIVKNAIVQGHRGKITLIHGGYRDEDLYCVDELERLSTHHLEFRYAVCTLNGEGKYTQADITQKTLEHLTCSETLQAYVCGPKEIVHRLKTKLFLAGVASSKIYSDSFI